MDSKCRGQLQALLAGLEAQNTRGGNVNVCKIENNMTQFLKVCRVVCFTEAVSETFLYKQFLFHYGFSAVRNPRTW